QMRLMTDADPLLVASVYTVLQLPIIFLVIPAGVITDMVDRRRVMMWTHLWLCLSMGVLLWLVMSDRITPLLLLLCLPLIAIGQALRMPGIATLIPDLVNTRQIAAAVSLNAIAQNSSRMLGPALAGSIIAAVGVAAVLALNAAILAVIIGLFWRLRYVPTNQLRRVKWNSFGPAITEGLRFAAATPWKRNILIRLGSFFVCAAAIPALMAVRFDTSVTYGVMYGFFGTGSLLGLLAIGRLGHQRLDRRLSMGLVICALCMMLLGVTDYPVIAGPLLAAAGASWIFCTNSIMVTAQLQLEQSMRGRGLSFVYAVGTASLASGGLLWGAIARASSPGAALATSGICLLLVLAVTNRLSISAPHVEPLAATAKGS
ncbi:MAG: MFS transporter, partial [Gammaproteobacteria bacterium]|nr:MFS transporter [Gammaproteobacteria bacterium]